MDIMKEFKQTVVKLPFSMDTDALINTIENEVKQYWDGGWIFLKAEPDKLFESVCIYFEREVYVE